MEMVQNKNNTALPQCRVIFNKKNKRKCVEPCCAIRTERESE